jgi:hypothetical protein
MNQGFQMGHNPSISILTGDTLYIKNLGRQKKRAKERQAKKKVMQPQSLKGFGN